MTGVQTCALPISEQVLSGSDSLALSSMPSFHDLRVGPPNRLFAVLLAYMLQHGICGLRATATESVIELVDALSMWAVMADEDHAAGVFVDRVHNPEHARCLPLPCDRNRFAVTSVWERGLGSLTPVALSRLPLIR